MPAVDWSQLRHAHGPAGDVPILLQQARRASIGAYAEEPWFSLWSALCHRGDVSVASYAAVLELVAIARKRRGEHDVARECVLLAGRIELERSAPVAGRRPPAMPHTLVATYVEALAEGAGVAEALRTREPDPAYARRLEGAAIAMRGDATKARLLAGSDE